MQVPAPNGDYGAPQAMACVTHSFCETVGSYWTRRSPARLQLVAGWNGRRWTLQDGLDGRAGFLSGVSCPSASACMAVGASEAGVVATARFSATG